MAESFFAYCFYLMMKNDSVPFGLNKSNSTGFYFFSILLLLLVSMIVLFFAIVMLKYIFLHKSKWGSELAWSKLPSGVYDLTSIKKFY
jgi:hypothetical protein